MIPYLVLVVAGLLAFAVGYVIGRRGGRIVLRVVAVTRANHGVLTDAEQAAFEHIRRHYESDAS